VVLKVSLTGYSNITLFAAHAQQAFVAAISSSLKLGQNAIRITNIAAHSTRRLLLLSGIEVSFTVITPLSPSELAALLSSPQTIATIANFLTVFFTAAALTVPVIAGPFYAMIDAEWYATLTDDVAQSAAASNNVAGFTTTTIALLAGVVAVML
jgi:hypothetical protein